jgi:outer membrane murein-binding lipoprotein Lpp
VKTRVQIKQPAKRLAQRHRWGRQVGNDRITRVTVPLAFLEKALVFKESDVTPDNKAVSPMTGVTGAMTPPGVTDDVADDITDDIAPVTAALAEAVKTLRDQLEIANGRADRAESRIDELQAALTEERRETDLGADRPAGAPVVATAVPVTVIGGVASEPP